MKTLTWLIRNVIIHDRQLARPFVIIRLQTHVHCSGRKIKKKKTKSNKERGLYITLTKLAQSIQIIYFIF